MISRKEMLNQMEERLPDGEPKSFAIRAFSANLKTKEAGRLIVLESCIKIGSRKKDMINLKPSFNHNHITAVCVYLITEFNGQKVTDS